MKVLYFSNFGLFEISFNAVLQENDINKNSGSLYRSIIHKFLLFFAIANLWNLRLVIYNLELYHHYRIHPDFKMLINYCCNIIRILNFILE